MIQNTYKMRAILSIVIGLFLISTISAQKYAYVDTEYILDNIPEYKDAQSQVDELAEEFQEEVMEALAEIDKMYKNYQAESVLMPDDIKEKKLEEIRKKEDEVKDLQNQRFGIDGDLFLKREELVKPIQEKIFNAIEELATEKNYAFVFDKAGSLTILSATIFSMLLVLNLVPLGVKIGLKKNIMGDPHQVVVTKVQITVLANLVPVLNLRVGNLQHLVVNNDLE